MNKMIDKNAIAQKEQGVVLLTTLIFMLILLAMLRFTLTSARVEEQKAAIDLDMVSAREGAQMALDYVEQYVLEQGELYCIKNLGKNSAECKESRARYAGELFALPQTELSKIRNKKDGYKTVGEVLNKGLYTGEFIAAQASCQPFWTCINWPVDAHAVRNSARQIGGANRINEALVPMECDICATGENNNVSPRFVIERLTAEELRAVAPNFADSAPGIVILRVTAVGFGKGKKPEKDAKVGNLNLSNVMLQSTYILGG
ncbi:MAG: hypothetical protein Q4A06_09820 [Cardiobacteriaceae bacterium]|nr:hypothetical protein [Cardiobacteriaceae bacterium]